MTASTHQSTAATHSSLAAQIQAATGADLSHCYQCGKCSAGCPVAEAMEPTPSQVLRLLQYETPEFDRQVLQSTGIWLCLSCDTCHTRCPQTVDTPKIMDYLRAESLRQGLAHPKSRDIRVFHEAFLRTVETHGRLHEVGLIGEYKLRTGHLLKDLTLAPKLYRNGKLEIMPHRIEGKDAVKRMFERRRNGDGADTADKKE